jgi:flagellar biosynthesis chaperone FliJ
MRNESLKAQVTRLQNKMESVTEQDPTAGETLIEINARFEHYEKLNDKAIEDEAKTRTAEEMKEMTEIAERITNLKIAAKVKEKKIAALNEEKEKQKEREKEIQKIKIPKMELTTFSGKIEEWPTFWNIFEDTIHNNKEVSTINKLRYLINVIKEPASAHIKNMEIKAENYETAIKILEKNYNRPIQAVSNLFQKILDIPNNTQQEAKSIRNVATEIRQIIGQLEKMPNEHTHRNNFIAYIILKKLSKE